MEKLQNIFLCLVLTGTISACADAAITGWTNPPIKWRVGNGKATPAISEDLTIGSPTGVVLAAISDDPDDDITYALNAKIKNGRMFTMETDGALTFSSGTLDGVTNKTLTIVVTADDSSGDAIGTATVTLSVVVDQPSVITPSGVFADTCSRSWEGPESASFILFTDTYLKALYKMDIASQTYVSFNITQRNNPIAIDYDPVEGRIYWTDVILKQIRSIYIDGCGERVIRQLNLNATPDGIAVDSVSRLVYYTDTGNDVIAAIKMDGSYEKTIIHINLKEPRAIVLDPFNAKIYWTDWGDSPKIESANYDGSKRQVIINTGLGLPNGLALDRAGGKIYWADAHTNKIEVANTDGSDRYTVLYEGTHHFFDLSIFGNTLYFTDWKQYTVMSVPVSGDTSSRVGSPDFVRLNGIHVHQDSSKPQANACTANNGGCSHFCLPMSGKKLKCACPDGFGLLPGGGKCSERIRHQHR